MADAFLPPQNKICLFIMASLVAWAMIAEAGSGSTITNEMSRAPTL
jgi:hypothetical protein